MTQKPRRPSDGQAGKLRCPPLDPETIEQRVVARLARQDIFDRRPVPLLSFVMEESVLRRRYGGKDVLRGQLEQLLLIGQKKNVAIRVMPLDNEESAGVDGPFTIVTRGNGKRFMYAEAQLQRCRGRSVCRGRGQYARCARPGLQGRRRAHPHRVVGGVGRVRRTGLVGAGSLTLAGEPADSQTVLVHQAHQVPLTPLGRAQGRDVRGELIRCAQVAVAVPDAQ